MRMNPKFPRILLLFFCGCCLPVACALAAGPGLDTSQIAQAPVSLTQYFAVLEDPSLSLTLSDVLTPAVASQFKENKPSAAALNYGYSRSAYWLRLALRNESALPRELMLEVSQPSLGSVQLYQGLADGRYQATSTGMTGPFLTRSYANRQFVFPLTLPAHSSQLVYLRIQSINPTYIPATLWTPLAFHQHERNDYLAHAWYFGMASAMILFNLLLFIGLRDRIYLIYVIFGTCLALSLASLTGLAKEFLWPDAALWADISMTVGFSLSFAALLVFMRHMLDTKKVIPKFDPFLVLFIGVLLLSSVAFVFWYPALIQSAALLYIIASALVLGTSLYCAFRRQRSAIFFVGAYTMLLFGVVVTALRNSGVLPINLVTMNALQVGSAAEMLLLAFALADRFNVIRRDKARAQAQALEAHQQLVAHLRSSECLLEARVAERTDELQIMNRRLEALSARDGLTGIPNRRRFDEVLAQEWGRAVRQSQSLAVAMFDVDWFKKYNDHYGHQAGDECLRRVAATIEASVGRTGDLVARYGGEEFIFIAPATEGQNALSMAWKICKALEALALPHETSIFDYVTISAGVAAMVPGNGDTPDILVRRADEALYLAKEQGRNRAVLQVQNSSKTQAFVTIH